MWSICTVYIFLVSPSHWYWENLVHIRRKEGWKIRNKDCIRFESTCITCISAATPNTYNILLFYIAIVFLIVAFYCQYMVYVCVFNGWLWTKLSFGIIKLELKNRILHLAKSTFIHLNFSLWNNCPFVTWTCFKTVEQAQTPY